MGEVVDRVIEAAPAFTDELQDRAGAPEEGRYQPFILAPTQVDALPSTSGAKLVVAVMGVGLLMGAAWSIVADRTLRHLQRRRSAGRAAAAAGPPPPAADDEATQSPSEPVGTPAQRPVAEPVQPVSTSLRPQAARASASTSAANGQRRPKKAALGQFGRGAQERRRTGGK